MEFRLFIIAVALIVLVAGKSDVKPRERPGKCPAPKQIFNCERLAECEDDFDCVRYEKCCKSSCGRLVCTDIRKKKQVALEKTIKKGCPTPLWHGKCARECVRDKDCECSERCCFNGCGYECVKKVEEVCIYGQHPKATCTNVALNDCPKGYTCTLQTDKYEATGVCCKNPPIKPDCSLVRCAYPTCKGAYLEEGECCLKCPNCKMVVCPLLPCKNKFVPPGQCCPVCGPDCSLVLCPEPLCQKPAVSNGQCCPQCKDCSKVFCALPACLNAFKPLGDCCYKCPDCRRAICPAVFCENPIFGPGDCCGRCPPECDKALCPDLKCVNTFIPVGECCPKCKPPDCSAVLCLNPDCPGQFVPEGECCPQCPGVCIYKGQTYKIGESFPDDCNTCTCFSDGNVACTEMFCAPCEYNGVTYDSGTKFKDKCNTCDCSSGEVSCTEMDCGDRYCETGLKPIPKNNDCGGIAGLPCPKGSTCDFSNVLPGTSDGLGICCKEFMCPNGRKPFSKSHCGEGLECPKGFTCEFPKYEKSFYGYCCIDCRTVKCGKPQCEDPILLETECCPRCPEPCVVNGVTYPSGTSFMNQCNRCRCINGIAACTKKGCLGCETGIPALGNQICGGKAGLKCPKGYDCKFPPVPNPIVDQSGICCRKPVCPVKGQKALPFTYCNNDDLICPDGFTCVEQGGGKPPLGFCCPGGKPCIVDGIVYQPGEGYFDKCNRCTCAGGGLSICTLIACIDGCYEEGKFLGGNGASVPNDDPCLDCECVEINGRFIVDCARIPCPDLPCNQPIFDKDECCGRCPEKPCDVDGILYKSGESFFIECNRCRCLNGVPGCTRIGCLEEGCYLNGTFYKEGAYVESSLPCGKCRCVKGKDMKGTATYEVKCPKCCIEKEKFYQIGKSVPRVNPCEFCSCFDGPEYPEVICAIADCPPPQCKEPMYLEDECCPVCEVPGCFNERDGRFYDIGEEVLTGSPCEFCFCDKTLEITCNVIECAAPPCQNYVRDPKQCCPFCKPGCISDERIQYDFGEEVPNPDPCVNCRCERDGSIQCVAMACLAPAGCKKLVSRPGKCCPICGDCK